MLTMKKKGKIRRENLEVMKKGEEAEKSAPLMDAQVHRIK